MNQYVICYAHPEPHVFWPEVLLIEKKHPAWQMAADSTCREAGSKKTKRSMKPRAASFKRKVESTARQNRFVFSGRSKAVISLSTSAGAIMTRFAVATCWSQ